MLLNSVHVKRIPLLSTQMYCTKLRHSGNALQIAALETWQVQQVAMPLLAGLALILLSVMSLDSLGLLYLCLPSARGFPGSSLVDAGRDIYGLTLGSQQITVHVTEIHPWGGGTWQTLSNMQQAQ